MSSITPKAISSVKVNVGGSKTRRHHKLSRNRRIKKNKSMKQYRKTRKS